jgi:hypothetical protein
MLSYLNKGYSLFSFVMRHFVASIISLLVPVFLTAILYFILLFIAMYKDYPLGSPVALPIDILVAGILALCYTTFLLFPSVALAEIISMRVSRFRLPAQMILSTLILLGLLLTFLLVLDQITEPQNYSLPVMFLFGVIILPIPLGIYWWSAKAMEAVTRSVRWGLTRLVGVALLKV